MRGDLKEKSRSNVTISVDKNILEEIKSDAQGMGLSINAYLNEALQRYIVFYRHVKKQGGVILPRGFFINLLDLAEEERISKIFEREGGFDVIISILAQNNIPITLDNLIKFVFEGIASWAGGYDKFSYQKDKDEKTRLVFEHGFGTKWSKALGSETSKLINQHTGRNSTTRHPPLWRQYL